MSKKRGTSIRSLQRRLAEERAEKAKLREQLDSIKDSKIEEVDAFKCGSGCGNVHEEQQEAFECQGGEEITAYRCKECDTLHEEEDESMNCCK